MSAPQRGSEKGQGPRTEDAFQMFGGELASYYLPRTCWYTCYLLLSNVCGERPAPAKATPGNIERPRVYLLLTTYHIPRTTYYVLLTTYYLLLITYCVLLTTYYVQLTTDYLLLTTH